MLTVVILIAAIPSVAGMVAALARMEDALTFDTAESDAPGGPTTPDELVTRTPAAARP